MAAHAKLLAASLTLLLFFMAAAANRLNRSLLSIICRAEFCRAGLCGKADCAGRSVGGRRSADQKPLPAPRR